MTYDALDDFAGPGGWDEGARMIGLTTIGIEWDMAACQTAKAAGHDRIRADVSAYPSFPFLGIPTYIGSPPCTLFSAAGDGVAKLVLDVLGDGIRRIFVGEDCREDVRAAILPVTLAAAHAKNAKRVSEKQWPVDKVAAKAQRDAFTAALVLEPARRIVELNPESIALEQVPEVLPLWHVYVECLRRRGYSAVTGVLNAANFGVPQLRKRAVVIASRVRAVTLPTPTHSEHGHDDLFGGRRKWITFAEALGWGPDDEPSHTVSAGGAETGGAEPFANKGYRERLSEYVIDRRQNSRGPQGTTVPVALVPVTRPAPTLTGESGSQWVIRPAWVHERPATTIVGSFRPDIVSAPGYRTEVSRQNAEGGVQITVAEGGVLQSFPADYPWQGNKGKQFQQVGNAMPPLLAAHVLAASTGREAILAAYLEAVAA